MSTEFFYEVIDPRDGHTSVWTRSEDRAVGYLRRDSVSIIHVYEPTDDGRSGRLAFVMKMTRYGIATQPYV